MYLRDRLEGLIPFVMPTPKPAPEPYTVANLAAWLKTQDPEQAYEWSSCHVCLLATYYAAFPNNSKMAATSPYHAALESFGAIFTHVGPFVDMEHSALSKEVYYMAKAEPRTFGAALERVRKLEG